MQAVVMGKITFWQRQQQKPRPTRKGYFGNPTGVKLGVVNAAQPIGSVLALPVIGYLADRFGRKPVLLSGIILIVVAAIIQFTSISLLMFTISRLVVGFGGMFVPNAHRGKYTSAFWTMRYLGAIMASRTTFGCQYYQSEWAWRSPSIFQAEFPLVQLCFYAWVTESLRWLDARGRTLKAAAVLAMYHSGDPDSAEGSTSLVCREVAEITAGTTGWTALVATPEKRKRTLIAVCVGALARRVVSYYLTPILNTVGVTDTFSQTLINGLLQIFNFSAALSAAFLVDRLGRLTLFLWSGSGMLVSYIVWTACSSMNTETWPKTAGIMVVVCLLTFSFHYDIAYTPLLLGYPTDIFPYSIRSKGIPVEFFAIYGSLLIAVFVKPIRLDDTKGHGLEEIAAIFDGPQGVEGFEDSSDSKEEKILAKSGLHNVVRKERT
ncbi:general substrate transporter [Colletotrichum cereale]|nr:general substrate transporter [Colletotrichum cereale]